MLRKELYTIFMKTIQDKRVVDATNKEEEARLKVRTKLFTDFVEECDEQGISYESNEFRLISEFATRDGIIPLIKQKVSNLAELNLEELSDKDIVLILKRARLGLKRVVEQRSQFAKVLDAEGNPTGRT